MRSKLFTTILDKQPFWKRSKFTLKVENFDLLSVTRRFRGNISWGNNPFKNSKAVKWEYDFIFSEDFVCIESGSIIEKDENGEKIDEGSVILH